MRFYDLNLSEEEQWVLGLRPLHPNAKFGEDLYGYDVWAYSRCERLAELSPVPFEVIAPGPSIDYNRTAYGAIVLSHKTSGLFHSLFDDTQVQFLPADIEGVIGHWEVLNIVDRVDCLDHEKSLVRYHDENHPSKPGKPRSVEQLIIDPARAEGHDLFRLTDWEVAVIASERIKQAMEEANITGVEFWPVC